MKMNLNLQFSISGFNYLEHKFGFILFDAGITYVETLEAPFNQFPGQTWNPTLPRGTVLAQYIHNGTYPDIEFTDITGSLQIES